MAESIKPIYSIISSVSSNELVKTLLLFLLIPLVVEYFKNNYFSNLAQKKNVWLNFIQKNQEIKDCIFKYNKVEKDTRPNYWIPYVCLFGSLLVLLIFFFSTFILTNSLYGYVSEISSLIPVNMKFQADSQMVFFEYSFPFFLFFILVIPGRETVKIGDLAQNLSDGEVISKYSSVKWRTSAIISFLLVVFAFSINLLTQDKTYFWYIVIILICLYIFYRLLANNRMYQERVKNTVNKEFSRKFPYIEVSTVGAEKFTGKIKNVFDNEAIRVIDNDIEISIMWEAVASLKETKIRDKDKQKHLDDFFKYMH